MASAFLFFILWLSESYREGLEGFILTKTVTLKVHTPVRQNSVQSLPMTVTFTLGDTGYVGVRVYLIGLCTGVSSKALCGTGSGIVTERFSTSEKAYLLKTWISKKHIDLLLPSAVTPEGGNSEFIPIFSNPLVHWLSGGSTDMNAVFLSNEFLCLPLISV